MTLNFKHVAGLVEKNFNSFTGGFSVDVDRDELWEIYLNAFPAGTDDVFRVRAEHDCTCCRHFIRNLGAVVDIADDCTAIQTPQES